ncbi:thioredoxin [Buchnera aphidicola]|uniref:Thioredoxin n=1 Tax=Buchnera aphidicola (Sarucallis kahawaluokalani) TaxID=1241878 RepID=A0A4D6YII1_9GAMM|nr:thioredoxin [Buchnera aphidicola]QCI26181.1 thioredoxin [Buchnera aphidicola (Sarucallis kahawaluokalani)]
MCNTLISLTNKNFDSIVLNDQKPVIVDFWADWCGPCKIFVPILEEISKEYKDLLIVAKVNVDDCKEIMLKYSIQSIPTLLFFKNKKLIERNSGVISKSEIKKLLSVHFNI